MRGGLVRSFGLLLVASLLGHRLPFTQSARRFLTRLVSPFGQQLTNMQLVYNSEHTTPPPTTPLAMRS